MLEISPAEFSNMDDLMLAMLQENKIGLRKHYIINAANRLLSEIY